MDFGRTSADKTYTCRRLLFSSLEECEKQSLFYQGKLETMRCCVFLICHRPGRILGVLSFAPPMGAVSHDSFKSLGHRGIL